ncbi:MAG: hypothetical protein FWD37_02225 [Methanomassiliicoccaceae archaeon]|nr:hypothetical protein [Methanomassiliicoccaceae archaeon]
MSEILSMISVAAVTAVLISASVQDIRTREVSDIHWLITGIIGMVMMIICISDNVTVGRLMICIGSLMILSDILYDRENSLFVNAIFYTILAAMFLIPLISFSGDTFVSNSVTIPVCYLIFLLFFYTGTIKGGADVKCLISLSILFPVYPVMFCCPFIELPSSVITSVISFPLAVLFHAALFSVIAMIPVMIRNIIRGDTRFPNMLSGYMMNKKDVSKAHVWVMSSEEFNERVWVTPKIPFIVPITAAVLFVAFIGNIIFTI